MSLGKWGLACAGVAMGTLAVAAPNGRPRAILYVTNSGGNDVTLVDVATNKTIGNIETGDTPHGLEASADGRRVYVSGETDDDIVAIDTATSTVQWKAKIGDRPNHIALSADGRYVYAPIRSANYADVVDTRTRERIKSIPVGRSPHNAYRAPNGKWVYVTSMGEDKITIVDVATQSALGAIPVGGEPRPAAITNDNKRMYVALTGLHGFVIADIAQRKVIDKVELPPAEVQDVSTYGYTPTHGIALRPDNKQFWITNVFGNAVEGFSEPENKLLGTVPVGLAPNWMTFGLDGKLLYVSNAGSNDVSVIDTDRIKEVARVPVGLAPKRLLVVNVPEGMGGPEERGWMTAAKRPSTTDYYLKGGGILSCETYSFRDKLTKGELTIEQVPAFYRKLGIRGISINARYIQAWDNASLDRLKKAIREEGRILTALILNGNLVADNEAANQKQIEDNKRLMRGAKYLGAPVVRINVGQTGRGNEADQTIGVERAIAAFKQMLPTAKELGIKMTIENHGGASKTADGILHIIKGTDPAWVGSCLDFGNWQDRSTMYAEIAKLAPYAYHTHAKCHAFDKYGDESGIDYRKALGPLQKTGYGAAISIEYEGKGDPVDGVIKMRDLLVKLWIGTAKN
ncbi:MAG: TIM barrel protein [Acidobacteria bacterium]|nr:TIM barrel protein [Acidobacteriota bacterium]